MGNIIDGDTRPLPASPIDAITRAWSVSYAETLAKDTSFKRLFELAVADGINPAVIAESLLDAGAGYGMDPQDPYKRVGKFIRRVNAEKYPQMKGILVDEEMTQLTGSIDDLTRRGQEKFAPNICVYQKTRELIVASLMHLA